MTQDVEQQLAALSHATLAPIVRRAIGEDAELADWSFSRLPGDAINPISAGIYRFTGNARYHGHLTTWSLMLKIAQWVDLSGSPLEKDYMNEPADWNYWKREALAYQSGILEDWRGDLVPVKCFAVAEPTDTTVWMWQEEVHESNRSIWPVARHILAAKHFGEFNGAHAEYLPSASDDSWLCRRFIRHWMQCLLRLGLNDTAHDANFWNHPDTRLAFPQGTDQRLQHLIADTDVFCDLLEEQPQTLSHQDTYWPNLFATHDTHGKEQTTVIDWSFLGFAAIGEDLGTQISGNLANLFIDPALAKAYYETAFDAYIDGLHQAGWHGDNKSVRFACAATASLRYATFEVMMLKWCIGDKEKGKASWVDDLAQKQKLTIEETLIRWGTAISFLFNMADEARHLASQL